MFNYPSIEQVWKAVRRECMLNKLAATPNEGEARTRSLWQTLDGKRVTYDVMMSRLTELHNLNYISVVATDAHEFYSGVQVGSRWCLGKRGLEVIQQAGNDFNMATLLRADIRKINENYLD